jgi:hypothetical protein
VSKSVLNQALRDKPKHKHKYTTDICRDLILWAWSRSVKQIVIENETLDAILAGANALADAYTASIPLVEPADQRLKLARLAISLAARTFSTDDNERIIVRLCHVEAIVNFLNEQYSKRSFGYSEYSKLLKGEQILHDEAVVKQALEALPYAADVVQQLLETQGFTIFDLMDWTELDRDQARLIISTLIRKNAIKRGMGVYVKTPAFIAFLRCLDLSKELHNKSLVELEEGQGAEI